MPRRSKVNPLVLATSVFLLRAASVWAGEAATIGLTVHEFARMEKGEVVVKTQTYATGDDKRAARVTAYCLINKHPDAVWAVMLNYHQFDEFMPRLEKVQVLEKTKNTLKVTQTIPVPLGVIRYTLDLIFRPAQRTVSWVLDKSRRHDIADTSGAWEFLPYGQGKTILRYTTTVNSGMTVPRFLEDFLIKNDLPEVLLSMRRRTESDGTWRKEPLNARDDLRPIGRAGAVP